MRTSTLAALLVLSLSSTALAQPGAKPAPPGQPAPAKPPAAKPPAPAKPPAAKPEPAPAEPAAPVDTERARAAFNRGADLVKESEWAKALDAFEESFALRAHPVTRYNIGVAQRALGQYVAARASLQRALEMPGDDVLPTSLADQAKTLLAESDGIVVRAELTVTPSEALVTVDGRPLEARGDTLVAGAQAGQGTPIPEGKAALLLDPGPHVFVLARKGFADAVVNKTFRPGERPTLAIALDTLPATLHVDATQKQARVTIDGVDVGYAPVDVPRPAGAYKVEVTKPGFVTFSTRVTLQPGAESKLKAPLPVYKKPLTEEWWFWTSVSAGVSIVGAGVAVGTYYATREPPTAAPPSGGSLGWAIDLR